MKRILLLALIVFSCSYDAPSSRAASRPLVGAIRWDSWYSGSTHGGFLAPSQWHSRLPFYTTFDGDTPVIDENRQEIIDTEVDMAIDAGLDYWAFDYLSCRPIDGMNNYALNLYLQCFNRRYLAFCLILLPSKSYLSPANWTATAVPNIVHLSHKWIYQRVLGNRPLIYFLAIETYIDILGEAGFRSALAELEAAIIADGNGAPYYVAMSGWEYNLEALGFDAISAYCTPEIGEPTERPHVDLKNHAYAYWDWLDVTGHKVVPTLPVGWDPRPCIDRPPGLWYTMAQPYQIANNLNYAINWTQTHLSAEANTIVIYAWNEFSEGGWICPTLAEGNARLQAIKSVLNP